MNLTTHKDRDFELIAMQTAFYLDKFFCAKVMHVNSLYFPPCRSTNQLSSCKFLNGCHSRLLIRSECEVFDLCQSSIDSTRDYECCKEMSKSRQCFELPQGSELSLFSQRKGSSLMRICDPCRKSATWFTEIKLMELMVESTKRVSILR